MFPPITWIFCVRKKTPKSFTRKGSSKKCLKNAAIIFMHLRRRLQRRKSVFANTHIASFWITLKFSTEHVYLKKNWTDSSAGKWTVMPCT